MKKYLILFSMICLCGCFQTSTDDSELRTVPVTNNPHIIPNHGSSIPGMGESTPY